MKTEVLEVSLPDGILFTSISWFSILSVCLGKNEKLKLFTIQLIFATIHDPTALFDTIHESHRTIYN